MNNKIPKTPKRKKKNPKKNTKIVDKKEKKPKKKNITKNRHKIEVTKIIERMKERYYFF